MSNEYLPGPYVNVGSDGREIMLDRIIDIEEVDALLAALDRVMLNIGDVFEVVVVGNRCTIGYHPRNAEGKHYVVDDGSAGSVARRWVTSSWVGGGE